MKRFALILVAFLLLCSFTGSFGGYAEDGDDWPLEESFTVSGVVWHDLNRNGIKEDGEPGVSGVTVRFIHMEDDLGDGSGTSNAYGNYKTNEELYAGKYVVYFEAPSKEYTKTATIWPGGSACGAELELSKDNSNVNIGLIKLFVLSGEVYEDINENGKRDEGEPPLAAEVKLDWGANTAINSDTTKEESDFKFAVEVFNAKLSITPLDASYKTLGGEERYEEDIDFSSGDITGKSYGFSKKIEEPIETPEPTETPAPTEPPEPTETPSPTPEPTESPVPTATPTATAPPAPAEGNKPEESPKPYEPPTANNPPTYKSAQEKKKDGPKPEEKHYTSTGKAFITGSKTYYSNEGLKNNSFTSETAEKARLGNAEDRALLNSLLRNIESDFVGWIFINGAQYYCAGNGTLLSSGFKFIDGEYYYFTPSGEALFMLTR